MPELPEVETVRRGISPVCMGQTIVRVIIRDRRLRWPIDQDFEQRLVGQSIHSISRRSKYLIFKLNQGYWLLHLGMSGVLRLLTTDMPVQKHDHLDVILSQGVRLRFYDPRRFGASFWCEDVAQEPRLAQLGPEPLSDAFSADYLYQSLRRRKSPIKPVLMNNHLVVGVGNIYANESLFLARISPLVPANVLSQSDCQRLVAAIKQVLHQAIKAGGTTLKDFKDSRGKPGYFQQQLLVYARQDQACVVCGAKIIQVVQAGRSSYYCASCQPLETCFDKVSSHKS